MQRVHAHNTCNLWGFCNLWALALRLLRSIAAIARTGRSGSIVTIGRRLTSTMRGARVKHIPHGRRTTRVRNLAERADRTPKNDGRPRCKTADQGRRWHAAFEDGSSRPKMASRSNVPSSSIFEHFECRGHHTRSKRCDRANAHDVVNPHDQAAAEVRWPVRARRLGEPNRRRSGENHARQSRRRSGPSMASRSPAI